MSSKQNSTMNIKFYLDLSNLEEIFNFSYFYLDECYADIKEYEINKNIPGEYKIHIGDIVKCSDWEMKINSFSDMRILIDQLRTEYKLLDD